MVKVAHPTGFEPVTFAFGAFCPGYPKYTPGHAMILQHLETSGQFRFSRRNPYPGLRSEFHPAASVVLPRKQPFLGGRNC